MQQYGNNGRPYDQNRDSLRSSGSSQRTTPPNDGASDTSRYGFNGEPLSRPPARTANGTVRRTRTDNSIEFPTQPRPVRDTGSAARRLAGQRSTAQRPRSSGGQNRRPAQRPANRNGRPAQNSRSAARQQQQGQGYNKNQKLRPAPQRDAQRREGRKKRRLTRAAIRRRRMLRRLATFGLLLCVIGIGMYLTVTMLFRISAIQVQTADGTQVTEIAGYSADSILQTLGVQVEENIFSFDPASKAAALEQVFPMLENIRVERDYPGTVVIQVTEAQPAYTMQTSGGWLTLSASLKILSSDGAQPAGLPTLYGGEPVSQNPGTQLSFEQPAPASSAASDSAASDSASGTAEEAGDKRLDSLNTLLAALDTLGMRGDVTRIEFADPEEMSFLYQDRISVLLGTLNELDYKLKLAQHVLLNADGSGCAATDTGTLDFTHISMSSTRKFTFAQGEPKLPSGYVVPEPAAEDTAADDAAPAEEAAASEGDAAAEPPADGAAEQAVPEAETSAEADPAPAAQEPAGTGAAN